MAYSDTLISQKNSFNNLGSSLSEIANHLNAAYTDANSAATNIENCFLVDGSSADNQEIKQLANKIESLKNSINHTMISSVNNEVNNLNGKISNQLAQEEAARKAEEERQKAERENK